MTITINKDDIFATETIERAGLSSDFEQFAKEMQEKKNQAEKKFNDRTVGAAMLGMGGLAVASASIQGAIGEILPSSPTLIGACMTVGIAGGLGIAAMELMKKQKLDGLEKLKTPYNFFKEKMKIKDNEDGTLSLDMKSSEIENILKESPIKLTEKQKIAKSRIAARAEIEEAGLSDEFAEFAKKNQENYLQAQLKSDPLKEKLGVLGASGLVAASAQIQYKLATATSMSDHSIHNIMSSENPMIIGAALVGIAGTAGFSVATYLKHRKLSEMQEDIYNPHNFLNEIEEKQKERNEMFSSNKVEELEKNLINELKVDVVEKSTLKELNPKSTKRQKLK